MKKIILILSILLMFPMIANAETSQNNQPYHPLGCAFSGTCSQRHFTDFAEQQRGTYYPPKQRTHVTFEGQKYTVLEYDTGKRIEKGWL